MAKTSSVSLAASCATVSWGRSTAWRSARVCSSATARTMIAAGATQIVECCPGRVLTSLNRRVDKNRDLKMIALEDPKSFGEALGTIGR